MLYRTTSACETSSSCSLQREQALAPAAAAYLRHNSSRCRPFYPYMRMVIHINNPVRISDFCTRVWLSQETRSRVVLAAQAAKIATDAASQQVLYTTTTGRFVRGGGAFETTLHLDTPISYLVLHHHHQVHVHLQITLPSPFPPILK